MRQASGAGAAAVQFEDKVRRALEDEVASYRPSDWSRGRDGVRARIARRRRNVRTTMAVTFATAGTAAAAVLGVVLAGGQGPAETSAASASGPASGSASGSASASASPSASANVPHWPAVRIVPAGQTVVFEHQIWVKLTASERCEGMGLPHGGFSCKTVTDGNQPQGTVSLDSDGDVQGTDYAPLYIGPGDVARVAITVDGVVHPATVVKLAGHPGYATAYLWLPATVAGRAQPAPADTRITVYDARGAVLAAHSLPALPTGSPSH